MSDFIPIAVDPPDYSKVIDQARKFYVENPAPVDKDIKSYVENSAPVGNTAIPWVVGGVVAAAAFVLFS